ncbi:hypothetical protein CHLNCDRAFT_144890 [Chlorella variabilis]|uniref:ATP-grasp domain-containing protein n=1 Tax=Chlorella variabilis TaxID=554065 RepID=E1ZD85_CHLVA|nr:hypothetical protein CHLNCDRAFT_144890 [Chlorella variabilis]EFN56176.1 hypothetical protein CHLNCDRAFT_144890 [Chlorella variabilis]|eukprot:XP_005848278.1 hypothetical protein CHLNCDRAFT_144890 [Chlorella variabilis]
MHGDAPQGGGASKAQHQPGNVAAPPPDGPPAAALPALGSASPHIRLAPSSLRDPNRNFITEAVIGSLPAALPADERQRIQASTPLSTTLNKFSSMPRDKVTSPTPEGQRLRRNALKGALLVFITAGLPSKRFVFEKAKELGVRVVLIDGPESWSKVLVEEGVIEWFVPLDMSDADTVFHRCLAAIRKVHHDAGQLDGVLSFCEMAMPLVARLAERLGLPGNPPGAVDAARDKHATREVLAAAGLPTPRNFLITSPRQLAAAADAVRFPAVIKPICGAASIGVVRVDDFEHLQQEYTKVRQDIGGARVVAGALQQGGDGVSGHASNGDGNASSWINTDIMLEEYLDGPEVDVDLVLSGGEPVYGAVNDNWPTLEPYFNETGSNGPSTLPLWQQRELCELAVGSVKALGFTSGVYHVELKQTSRGARLIEVNCRMGGGVVSTMNLLVWGVDLVEEQLLCSAGIPSRPPVAPQPLMQVAEYIVNARRTGVLRSLAFLDRYQGVPGVLYAKPCVPAGAHVVCKEDGLPTWVCQVLVTKPTLAEAIQWVTEIEEEISRDMPIE